MKKICLLTLAALTSACSGSRLTSVKQKMVKAEYVNSTDYLDVEITVSAILEENTFYYLICFDNPSQPLIDFAAMVIFSSEREVSSNRLYPSVGITTDKLILNKNCQDETNCYKGINLIMVAEILEATFLCYIQFTTTETVELFLSVDVQAYH